MERIVNSLADKFNEKIKLDENLIISGGLVLNAFALMELIKGNFVLFLIGTVMAFFTDRLVKETLYQRVAEWIKLFTVLAFFTRIYRRKINNIVVIVALVLLLLCNINYTVERLMIYHAEGEKNNLRQEELMWIKPYKNISREKIKKISLVSQYFSETYTLVYIGILIIIIHLY